MAPERRNGNGRRPAPLAADHPNPARHLQALDDGFPDQAEAAFAEPVPRARPPGEIPPLHCLAFCKGDLKFGRGGTAEITLQIPWEYRDRAEQLLELAGKPLEMYLRQMGPRR
jgi:hypothetical protein